MILYCPSVTVSDVAEPYSHGENEATDQMPLRTVMKAPNPLPQ